MLSRRVCIIIIIVGNYNVGRYKVDIVESVDSISRDGLDTPIQSG